METLKLIIGLLLISFIECQQGKQQYQQGPQQYQQGSQQQYQVQHGQQQYQQGQQVQQGQQQYQQGQQQYQQGQQQYQPGHQQQGQHRQGQYKQVQGVGQHHQQIDNKNIIREKSHVQDREHIQEHLQGVVDKSKVDISKMTEEELQFHYFKMHDSDGNNQLDGTELCKSIIHWHVEESMHNKNDQPIRVFTDQELMNMIDPILQDDDSNQNGFIDYAEFVFAQQARSASQVPP